MQIAKTIIPYIICAFGSISAYAGEFHVACTYTNDNLEKCADIVSDLITDKFTSRFPASKYSIFVHSNIHSYSNGGYAAYAVAGVVPRGSGEFPIRRFSTSVMNGQKRATSIELSNIELETYRDSVKELMDKCEISSTCDIYTPRKISKK